MQLIDRAPATAARPASGAIGAAPDWWHRDHPVSTPVTGFVAGLVLVTVVPGAWVGLLRLLLPYDRAEELVWMVLLALALPAGLVAARRTRRFGLYLLLGMVVTAVVVLGVASLVRWLMVAADG